MSNPTEERESETVTMQTEPIAEPQQDAFIDDMAEFLSEQFEAAFALLVERRDEAYNSAIAPLQAEQIALAEESASIREAQEALADVLPAKRREAQRQGDEALLAGKAEELKAALAEMQEAENAPAAMEARQRELDDRYREIEGEKEVVSRRVISAWLGECQAVTRASEHGFLVVLLAGLKRSLAEFKDRTGTAGWDPRFGFQGTGDLTAGAGSAAHAIGCDLYEHDHPVRVRITGEVRS